MSSTGQPSLEYWTVTEGVATRTGWSCRECRRVIGKGEKIIVRDARKMRLFYHAGCFSGSADPRTQTNSSFATTDYHLSESAPAAKGKGKWTVRPETYGFGGPSAPPGAALPANLSSSIFGLPPLSAKPPKATNLNSSTSTAADSGDGIDGGTVAAASDVRPGSGEGAGFRSAHPPSGASAYSTGSARSSFSAGGGKSSGGLGSAASSRPGSKGSVGAGLGSSRPGSGSGSGMAGAGSGARR